MDNGMARLFKWAGVLVFAAFSTVAFSATCDPDENTWVPSRYYPPGKTVFHHGHWYESRELQEGKTPGSDFEWKKLASAPDCRNKEDPSLTGSGKNKQQPPQACNEPGRWSFGASYTVGQMAIHEGQTYRAIRPSNGQMPGMSQPPHWEPIDHPCKNRAGRGS